MMRGILVLSLVAACGPKPMLDINLLRRILGLYDPDPVIDADKTQHTGLITFGNDRTGRWAALPALMPSEELARTILRITREQNPGFPSRLPR